MATVRLTPMATAAGPTACSQYCSPGIGRVDVVDELSGPVATEAEDPSGRQGRQNYENEACRSLATDQAGGQGPEEDREKPHRAEHDRDTEITHTVDACTGVGALRAGLSHAAPDV